MKTCSMIGSWSSRCPTPSWDRIEEPVYPLSTPPPQPRIPVVPDDPQTETELTPVVPPISVTQEVHIAAQEFSAPQAPLSPAMPPAADIPPPSELVPPQPAPPLELASCPRRNVAIAASTPGYYRNLNGVHFTHLARHPYDDLYGCNMHYGKASALHGQTLADAAITKEVISIFGAFKAVTPVNARTLTKDDQILPFFMFYKAKALTPAEIIAAKSAQAEQARLSTRTHSAQAPECGC
jgi:hypothetical protein